MTSERSDLFPRLDGQLAIGGIPVADLAGEFGTPLYVFDAGRVRAAVGRLRSGFRDREPHLLYSIKAWANVALLEMLRELNVGVDACSPGDLAFATAAGYPKEAISYCGQGLTAHEIDLVERSGATFVAGSVSQLDQFGARRGGTRVGVRVNCGIEAGFHAAVQAGAAGAKFGVMADRFAEAVAVADHNGTAIIGLHGHVGSDIAEVAPYLRLLDCLLELADRHRLPLEFVDLGGGFGVPFTDSEASFDTEALGAAVEARLARFEGGRSPVELRLEPGAYLVREAGYLLTRVCEVEHHPARPGLLSVDSSVNHLPGAAAFGAAHPVRLAQATSAPPASFTVGGNLMLAGDILRNDLVLPMPVPGDVLVFGLCGAYTGVRATTFNERPRPGEVLVDAGEVREIRRAETVDDLLRGQVSLHHPTG